MATIHSASVFTPKNALKGVNRVSKRPNIDHIPHMDPNFPKENDVFWICLDA